MSEIHQKSPEPITPSLPECFPKIASAIKKALERYDAAELEINETSLGGMLNTADGDFGTYAKEHDLDYLGLDEMEMRQPKSNLHFAMRGHAVDVPQEGRTVHLKRSYRLVGDPIGDIREKRYRNV